MLTQTPPSDKILPAGSPVQNLKKLIRIGLIWHLVDLIVTIGNTLTQNQVTRGNTLSLLSSDLRPTEITIVVVLIASLVLLPPLLHLWFAIDSPWYLPYLVWFGIILLSYYLQRLLRKNAI
jgi:hypothetical protein